MGYKDSDKENVEEKKIQSNKGRYNIGTSPW